MTFKILQHKTLKNTYGRLDDGDIFVVSIPDLYSYEMNYDEIIKFYSDDPLMLNQLEKFDLLTVELNIL